MQHKCMVEVIDKKLFRDYQEKYLADPESGVCPFYEIGQVFVFERYGKRDDFWTEGNGAHCAEAWDCISRYIYTALQGGSIMRNWTNSEKMMIACCNDGTRSVIFKIERIDYKVLYIKDFIPNKKDIAARLKALEDVIDVNFTESFAEVIVEKDIDNQKIENALLHYEIIKID